MNQKEYEENEAKVRQFVQAVRMTLAAGGLEYPTMILQHWLSSYLLESLKYQDEENNKVAPPMEP